MKKSLLVASLAVVSANVLGMNPLDNNNLIGNNPGYVLTPDSSPKNNTNLIESIQESVSKFSQGDLPEDKTHELVNTMFSIISSQETTQSRIFELEQKISNLEEQNRQFLSSGFKLNASSENLLNQTRLQIAEKDNIISGLNDQVAQFQFANQQLVSSNKNLHRINAQLTSEKRTLNQNLANLQLRNQQLQSTNQNLDRALTSTRQIINRGLNQILQQGSITITKSWLLKEYFRTFQGNGATISEIFEDDTMEQAIVLRSSAKKPAPENDSVSQPSAQRRRIDPEEATSSSMRSIPTASPMVFPANQQAISMEKLKEMIKLPEYPEGYKEAFFDAIEEDLNIDKATAEDILESWRGLELEAFRSVIGLTEGKLNEWRQSKKKLMQKNDNIFKNLITEIRKKKGELCGKYEELSTKDNIYKLIEYHDYMLIRFDDLCSSYYKRAIYCNNSYNKSTEILSWLKNNELTKRQSITEKEREDILSKIIEDKQWEQIKKTYPNLSKQTNDNYARYIRYWFWFPEQDLFKKKINGEELDKELTPLDLKKSTLDTNALADLIRFGRLDFIERHKDYDYNYYNSIASVWKILATKNFKRPNWCGTIAEQRLETSKKKSESGVIAKKAITIARNYLKSIDKDLPGMSTYRPDKQGNVISFYKWKLDEHESLKTGPKKSILGTESEFTKNVVYEEVQKYFDLNYRDIRRVFAPYRGQTEELRKLKVSSKEEYDRVLDKKRREYHAIPARNIAAEVDDIVSQFREKYNILDMLNDIRAGNKVNTEAQSESQKIVGDLWEMGFSHKRIIELLGLKDDFEANYPSTTENLTDSSSDAGTSSSSSAAQTRKRNADSNVESTSSKKRDKGKQRAED